MVAIEDTPNYAAADAIAMTVLYDPPEDPYPLYKQLRELAPVHRVSATGEWLVSSYELCNDALKDPRFVRDFRDMTRRQHGEGVDYSRPIMAHKALQFSQLNPPEYMTKRTVLTKSVTPVAVSKLDDEITGYANQLLDKLEAQGNEVDLVTGYNYGLTLMLICRVLGFPSPEDGAAEWLEWFRAFGNTFLPSVTEEAMVEADAAILKLNAMMSEQIEKMRHNPSDNMITMLMDSRYDGKPLPEDDIIANTVFMFAGAVATTADLISNAVVTLLQHPDQWRLLVSDPDGLAKAAIEEVLRFDNAVLGNPPNRLAAEDIEIGGFTIPAGEALIPMYGAANRDPNRFADPETFDIRREDNRPLSFGGGPHVCPGQHLARAQVRIAMTVLAKRYPNLTLVDPNPPRRTTPVQRGAEAVWVRLT